MSLCRLFVSVVLAFAWTTSLVQARPADFGQRWVRSHPLTLMGLQQSPQTFDPAEHDAANMTSVLAWWADGNGKQIAAPASVAGLPWHALIVDGEGDERERIANYASVGNAVGWMIGDELNRQQMPFFADIVAWTKENRPDELVYSNAYPTYAGDAGLYGGSPPGGTYNYAQYLDDMVEVVKPDVLMYDHYPFFGDGSERPDYFVNLMAVREKALEHGLPYWGFMQASKHFGYRLPSETDARFQMFSHLTAGFTGMAYFTFDAFGETSILNPAGNPSPLYGPVARINQEAANLGQALRFMTSTDVKYVAGRHLAGSDTVKNPIPASLADWSADGDPDDHILSIVTNNVAPTQNGLIGFFTDDNGDDAFMLMNTNHGPVLHPASRLSFTIEFDSSIDSLLRLDRATGEQVVVPLTDHRLTLSISAGIGELFKYNEGDFILSPVPEPTALSLMAMSVVLANGRGRSLKHTAVTELRRR
jgi:hypothetical protein